MIAAAMFGEPRTGVQATDLLSGSWDLAAPSHWKAEFANVLWKAVQLKRVAAARIEAIISRASALPIQSVDISELWRGAVTRAVVAGHPAYDTLFVELAIRLNTTVASFDSRLQRKFLAIVRNPADLLVE